MQSVSPQSALSNKVVVLLSGGLDSTVLMYQLIAGGSEVAALSVDYGQKHRKELDAARAIVNAAEVAEHQVADLRSLAPLLKGSALTSTEVEVPLGHYEDESMKTTVVPNRNMIMLSVATAYAITSNSSAVAYAAHGGDHAIYPDCRAEFADALARAINICDWQTIDLLRPFVTLNKSDIVRLGVNLGVPFHLTWSCYQGGEIHCGECGTCVERREAFAVAGVKDPTQYLSHITKL